MTGCSPAAILSPAVAAAPNRAVMYRGGPQRTGIYDTKGVAKLSGVKWQFQTGGPVWSSPVVANGVVYFGSDDGHLYAVDAQTGQEKWRFKTEDDVRSSPAIANGVAYVVSYDGNLYAVNIQTGQQVWKFTLFGDDIAKIRPSYDDYLSSPAVANGIVYVGSPDPRHGFYAIDAQTGQEKWSFKKQEGMIDMVRSSPAVSGDTVYFGGDFDSFHALDANTGQPKWTFKAAGTLNYAPAVGEDGTVYFSSKDTNLYAVNGQTGELKWKAHLSGMSWVTSSPAVLKDTVYAGTSDGCTLFALDVKTGQVKWKFPAHGYVWSSPSFAEGIVYVGSSGGRVYAVDAKTGQELWNFKTKGSVYSTPVVADGVVYIGSTDGTLYALQ
jgi:outer membrane protein assembly factor BamB